MHQFYDSIAERRDEVAQRGAVTQRVQTAIELVVASQPASVLDIACAYGEILEILRERLPQARLVGADISERYAQETRARGFEAVVGDVAAGLPLAAGSFDCISFGEVIEHLVDPDAAIAEIVRLLRPGGHLILTTPNLAYLGNRLLLLLGIQPVFTETSLHVNLGRGHRLLGQGNTTQGHLKIFTLGALREMLDAHGLRVEKVVGYRFIDRGLAGSLDRVVALVPTLAAGFVVKAQLTGERRSYARKFLSSSVS